jgi:ubiquinone/menaquinone biosynthesis C-methylase UbiE
MKDQKFTQKMQESWKEIADAWESYTPPTKPSPAEIYFWEYKIKDLILLQKRKNLKALVLGATPEFRDLLAKYKIKTTLIDNNQISIKAMTSLMKRKNSNEKIVIGNWLKMPFKENSFDLVLSDSAQDNIQFSKFNKFFNNVYKILKPEGCWFFGAVHVEKENSINFKQYLAKYKKDPRYFKNFQNFFLQFFQLCYDSEFYNSKTKTLDFTKIDAKIKDLVNKNSLPASALKDLCFNINYKQVLISVNDFKKMLSKKFFILAEMQDDNHRAMSLKWTAILKSKK